MARAALTSWTEPRAGYVPSGTKKILPRTLRAFRSKFRGIQVALHDLSAEEVPPLPFQRKLALALTPLPHKPPRLLDAQPLAQYAPSVVVGITHPPAKAKRV